MSRFKNSDTDRLCIQKTIANNVLKCIQVLEHDGEMTGTSIEIVRGDRGEAVDVRLQNRSRETDRVLTTDQKIGEHKTLVLDLGRVG